jgi:tetratricopeptide (TPR) repeat protein
MLKAMEKAKQQNKPIFVELYADWCTICKKMEKEVLPDPKVAKELEKFVTVRLNGEEWPNLMERYQVRGYPTLLFLDKYSNYISKLSGMPTKDLVIREAIRARENSDLEKPLLSALKENPKSPKANFELGVFYYQTENYQKSLTYFQTTIEQSGPGDQDLIIQARYNLALIQMNLDQYKEAIRTWTEFIQLHPNSGQISGAYLHRGIAYRELKNWTRASADLQKAKQISPFDEEKEIIDLEIQSLKEESTNRKK